MKVIYKRIQVNKELLKIPPNTTVDDQFLNKFLIGRVSETMPSGTIIGAYFNFYSYELPRNTGVAMLELPVFTNQTDIKILDTQGRNITATTDILDYSHKGGGYCLGFKELNFLSDKERVTIEWETIGKEPICGEFVFKIQGKNEC